MRTLLAIAILCAAPACVYDLSRPKPDAPQDGALELAVDGPRPGLELSSKDAPLALEASRKDGPATEARPADRPQSFERKPDGSKPLDTSKPLDKAALLPDKPKPDQPPPQDALTCAGYQCVLGGTACVYGNDDYNCGSGGPCENCTLKSQECQSFKCVPCSGCLQDDPNNPSDLPKCVKPGWINDNACGLPGGTCTNCNSYSGTTCDVTSGQCVPKPKDAGRP